MLGHGEVCYVHLWLPDGLLDWDSDLFLPPSVLPSFWANLDLGRRCVNSLSFLTWWDVECVLLLWAEYPKHQGWDLPHSLWGTLVSSWGSCESTDYQELVITITLFFVESLAALLNPFRDWQLLESSSFLYVFHSFQLQGSDCRSFRTWRYQSPLELWREWQGMGIAYSRPHSLFQSMIIFALPRHAGINELIYLEVLVSQAHNLWGTMRLILCNGN